MEDLSQHEGVGADADLAKRAVELHVVDGAVHWGDVLVEEQAARSREIGRHSVR